MRNLWEFFEDMDGSLSTNRLCQILVVVTLCGCLIMAMCFGNPNETLVIGLASIAAALAGGTYSLSKWRDTMPKKPEGK